MMRSPLPYSSSPNSRWTPRSDARRRATSSRVRTTGRPSRGLRSRDAVEKRQLPLEHLAIEEQQRALRLVLRRRRDVELRGEVRQVHDDFDVPELRWVAVPWKRT